MTNYCCKRDIHPLTRGLYIERERHTHPCLFSCCQQGRRKSAGEKVSRNGNGCEPCKLGSYQDHENTSKSCKACRTCDTSHGSEIKQHCTRFTNTRCACREDFVPWDSDSFNCKCAEGFKRIGGECKRCEEGFFITSQNSDCKKWKECKSGVKISGTASSDVICNEPNSDTYSTTLPTSNTITTLRGLITQRPQWEAQTQGMDTTTTPRVATSTKKVLPTPRSVSSPPQVATSTTKSKLFWHSLHFPLFLR
uniref:TNFR-Cys domain-containing protein n=1 Tax=Astatotilapia calliptera TaxID=8154 RepID=A0AAX7TAK3_ASTCA